LIFIKNGNEKLELIKKKRNELKKMKKKNVEEYKK